MEGEKVQQLDAPPAVERVEQKTVRKQGIIPEHHLCGKTALGREIQLLPPRTIAFNDVGSHFCSSRVTRHSVPPPWGVISLPPRSHRVECRQFFHGVCFIFWYRQFSHKPQFLPTLFSNIEQASGRGRGGGSAGGRLLHAPQRQRRLRFRHPRLGLRRPPRRSGGEKVKVF